MRTTQQMSMTLPNEMADAVKSKVKTGEYASESEVIRDGLRVLMARDRAVEAWLHNQVSPAYDALQADPSRAITVDAVRARQASELAKSRRTVVSNSVRRLNDSSLSFSTTPPSRHLQTPLHAIQKRSSATARASAPSRIAGRCAMMSVLDSAQQIIESEP